jgi:ubiquinol-cytochrome c reductase iron-sulfur subunit
MTCIPLTLTLAKSQNLKSFSTSDHPYKGRIATTVTMAHLPSSSRALLRCLPRTTTALSTVRCLSTSLVQKRADVTTPTSSFDSPFKGMGSDQTIKIPDFSHYKAKSSSNNNLLFQYFMVGTMGALTAAGAKGIVEGMKYH